MNLASIVKKEFFLGWILVSLVIAAVVLLAEAIAIPPAPYYILCAVFATKLAKRSWLMER